MFFHGSLRFSTWADTSGARTTRGPTRTYAARTHGRTTVVHGDTRRGGHPRGVQKVVRLGPGCQGLPVFERGKPRNSIAWRSLDLVWLPRASAPTCSWGNRARGSATVVALPLPCFTRGGGRTNAPRTRVLTPRDTGWGCRQSDRCRGPALFRQARRRTVLDPRINIIQAPHWAPICRATGVGLGVH